MARWSSEQIGDLTGQVFVITGANSGIGYEAARQFASLGARVVWACRSRDKAEAAMAQVRSDYPDCTIEFRQLDLASIDSVRSFVADYLAREARLDVLCNNGGVMALPLGRTADGFEMQLGTNHLGHFALTGGLLPRLVDTPGARVVTVSSYAHHYGRIAFDDLQSEQRYGRWAAYAQSKLANLLFALELDRRLRNSGSQVLSVCCHPGYSATNLQIRGAEQTRSSFKASFMRFANAVLAQSAAKGALTMVYAAVGDDIQSGDFIGPSSVLWGAPVKTRPSLRAQDQALAAELWQRSIELTGEPFTALRD